MKDREELEQAKLHSLDNELEILSSHECGCFFCRSHFPAKNIADWDYSDGHTQAICPECGMASVIGDASGYEITHEFLKEMNLAFYGPDYIQSHPEAARVYLDRYFGGKVNANEKNEKLAVSYLEALVAGEDVRAALALASLYETGGRFVKANPIRAEEIYLLPFLRYSARAQARLGALYLGGYNGALSKWDVFQFIMKSAVSGNFDGTFYLSICYFNGYFVDQDPNYAFYLLFNAFPDVYDAFVLRNEEYGNFIDYSYHISTCLLNGTGTEVDEDRALRYLLLAMLGIDTRDKNEKFPERGVLEQSVYEKLADIAAQHGLQSGSMVFDQDTFYDSFSEGIQANEKKRLVAFNFDPESHTLDLTIEFFTPTVLIDEGNLTSQIVSGKTEWHFTSVARFEGQEDRDFVAVMSPSEGIWVFGGGEEGEPIAFLFFDVPEGEAE